MSRERTAVPKTLKILAWLIWLSPCCWIFGDFLFDEPRTGHVLKDAEAAFKHMPDSDKKIIIHALINIPLIVLICWIYSLFSPSPKATESATESPR